MIWLSVHYPHSNTIQHYFMSAAWLNESSSSEDPLLSKERDYQASSFFPLSLLNVSVFPRGVFFLFVCFVFFFVVPQNLSAKDFFFSGLDSQAFFFWYVF